MAVVTTNPRTLSGPWAAGFALDWHTLKSIPIGPNAFGRMQFETTRPPVGQMLYELKYRGKTTVEKQQLANDLADTAADFLQRLWRIEIDAILPVPPSNVRPIQPVMLVAEAIGDRLGIPMCANWVAKVKQTPQLKDIKDSIGERNCSRTRSRRPQNSAMAKAF